MKKIYVLFFFLYSLIPLFSQDSLKFTLSWTPFPMFFNGFQVDFGIKTSQNSWVIFSPKYYSSKGNTLVNDFTFEDEDEFTGLTGYGMDLIYHYQILENRRTGGPYLGAGFTYVNYLIHYNEMDWYDIEYNGNAAVTYGTVERHTTINKYGPEILFGLQYVIGSKMMIDMYWGTGIRKSIFESDAVEPRKFNVEMWEPGYAGVIFVTGIRLGVIF